METKEISYRLIIKNTAGLCAPDGTTLDPSIIATLIYRFLSSYITDPQVLLVENISQAEDEVLIIFTEETDPEIPTSLSPQAPISLVCTPDQPILLVPADDADLIEGLTMFWAHVTSWLMDEKRISSQITSSLELIADPFAP